MGIQTQKIRYCQRWGLTKLVDVSLKITDGTHHTPAYTKSGISFISVKDIYNDSVHFDNCKFIDEKSHSTLIQRCHPETGDLLVTKSGTIGRMAIVPNEPVFSLFVSVALIKNKKHFINTKFLKFCLENYFNSISVDQDIKGGLLKNFHLEDIRSTEVPVVSLPEQHRIVAKIEELFSSMDKGIENLETARQQLKVYRQAVLKWAFEGRLTNENVADEELPMGWTWKTIDEICLSVEYGSAAKSKAVGKVPVLRMGNIQDGKFVWDDLVYTDDEPEIKKYLLYKNDILFNRTNSPEWVGKTAMYKGERPAIFAGYLIRINIIQDLIIPSYLTYYLNSPAAKNYGNTVKTFGVNQANINGTKLKAYPLPLPSFSEQEAVVSEIESRLSVCDKIEESIEQSLKQAELLKQSILKKAFEGKLVPQDPDDEPVSILLERIRAERETGKADNPQPKRKKVKAHDQR